MIWKMNWFRYQIETAIKLNWKFCENIFPIIFFRSCWCLELSFQLSITFLIWNVFCLKKICLFFDFYLLINSEREIDRCNVQLGVHNLDADGNIPSLGDSFNRKIVYFYSSYDYWSNSLLISSINHFYRYDLSSFRYCSNDVYATHSVRMNEFERNTCFMRNKNLWMLHSEKETKRDIKQWKYILEFIRKYCVYPPLIIDLLYFQIIFGWTKC